jgi:hypothetical protein
MACVQCTAVRFPRAVRLHQLCQLLKFLLRHCSESATARAVETDALAYRNQQFIDGEFREFQAANGRHVQSSHNAHQGIKVVQAAQFLLRPSVNTC